jgi:hypothetical protein
MFIDLISEMRIRRSTERSGGSCFKFHYGREGYLHSKFGPVITHAHSTIPVSVSGLEQTHCAHLSENDQI